MTTLNQTLERAFAQLTPRFLSGFSEYKDDFNKQRGHGLLLETTNSLADFYQIVYVQGIMMSFSWLVLGSIALVLPRYYRFLFQSKGFQTKKGAPVWRIIHTSLIVAIALISFGAFILVLESKDWKWSKAYPGEDEKVQILQRAYSTPAFLDGRSFDYIGTCDKLKAAYALRFTHSILGIVTLGLTIFYPILAFLRPKPEAKAAKAVDLILQLAGILIYGLALLAMVFGTIIFFNQSYATYLTGFRLEPLLLAGWAIWLLIYLSTLELAQRSINRSKNIIEGTSSLSVLEKTEHLIKIGSNEKIKFFLLALHIFLAISFEVVLIVFIAVYTPISPPYLTTTDDTVAICDQSYTRLYGN